MLITTPPIKVKPPTVRRPPVAKPKPGIPDLPGGSPLAAAAVGNTYGLPNPYSSSDVQRLLGQYTSGYPAGMTPGQIQTTAQGEISPIVAAITNSITGQTKAASDSISGYTKSLQQQLAGINFAAPYTQGEQAQAAVDAALQSSLAGAGTTDAADLASRLAVINDPAVAQAAQAVSANGTANAGTQVAQGSNMLGSLIAQAAAAGNYGLKQPGIAGEYGLQQLGTVQQNAQNQIAAQTAQVEQQLPQIISDLTSQSNTAATNKAQAASQLLQFLTGENDTRSQAITSAASNAAQLAEQVREFNLTAKANGIKIATDAAAAQVKAKNAAEAAAAKAAQTDIQNRLNFAKVYGYDPVTGQTIAGYKHAANGTVVKDTSAKGGKSLTPNEALSLVQDWHDGKTTSVRVPATDKDGNPVYDVNGAQVYTTKTGTTGATTYIQAVKKLVASGASRAQALQYADTAWKRGEGGRAWLTNDEQAVLRNGGVAPKARVVNGHGVLSGNQIAVLRKAGKLPPGQETAEGYYVIAQTF